MKQLFFSVIIPTLNEERYVPHLLKDIEGQNFHDFEVIVVDGNSTDKTYRVAQSYQDKFPLRLYSLSVANVSKQRNFGAHHARGKYLVFLDADSRILRTFLKKVKRTIDQSSYLILMPAVVPEKKTYRAILMFNLLNFGADVFQKIGNRPLATSGSLIFEKNIFFHIGGFDEKLFIAEDHEIIRRAKLSGVSCHILKDVELVWSTRRFKKEGQWKVLSKYIIVAAHYLKDGAIYDGVIEYEMGGKRYSTIHRKNTSLPWTFRKQLHILSQVKSHIKRLVAQ